MRRLTLAACVVVLWAAPARGQTPNEVKGRPCAFVVVKAAGAVAAWYLPDAGLERLAEPLKDDKTAVFLATKAGRYRAVAIGAGTFTEYTLVIEGEGPLPDAFAAALKTAWAAEAAPDRSARKADLANLYRLGAAEAKGNAALKTYGDLFNLMAATAKAGGLSGKLPALQAVVGAELSRVLPSKDGANVPLDRATAERELNRVAAAVEALK